MNIAIFGAAGAIGRTALIDLLAAGHTVRLVGRDRSKLEAMRADAPAAAERIAVEPADLSDAADARRAAAGVDAILYAVGVPYPQFEQHPALTRNAIAGARAAGVRSFLLISNVYPYGRARTAAVVESHPREPQTRKGRFRKEQADLVLAAHDPGGLRTASLILPDFYGPAAELSYANELFAAAVTGRTANVVGPLDVPREYVYVPDVGPAIAGLFAKPEAFGRSYNFGGPGLITTRDFIAAVERAAGTRIKTLGANKTLLRLLGTFNPLMREVVEMYYLFTDPVVLDDAALRVVLPNLTKTPYESGIRATVAALRRGRELAHGAA